MAQSDKTRQLEPGMRFVKLTLVELDAPSTSRWICRCDCGGRRLVKASVLLSGKGRSCGCIRPRRFMHGDCSSPEYTSYIGMLGRCHNPKDKCYYRYGARGIVVCEAWRNDFRTFLKDMGPKPSRYHSIDRIDNDGNYEPGNCRWATAMEQMNNRAVSRFIVVNGDKLTLSQAARKYGVKVSTIFARLARGWSPEKIVSEPIRFRRQTTQGRKRGATHG